MKASQLHDIIQWEKSFLESIHDLDVLSLGLYSISEFAVNFKVCFCATTDLIYIVDVLYGISEEIGSNKSFVFVYPPTQTI